MVCIMTFQSQATTIHANALVFNQKGLLILGESGSGKSDLTLRLIDNGGILISDDYTVLTTKQTVEPLDAPSLWTDIPKIWASCPDNIAGILEIRGLGIVTRPYIHTHQLDYVLALTTDYPRMPEMVFFEHLHIRIRQFFINPFELSVLNKIKYITDNDMI